MNKNQLSKTELSDELSSPEEKGKRLKRLRNLANLTREQMCEKGDVNIHTLVGWENGRFGGLTRAGAKRLLNRLEQEGVHCTIEWLLNGIGAGPTVITDFASINIEPEQHTAKTISNNKEEQLIANELILFRNQNPNATDFVVEDDGMSLVYNPGDYVAGRKRYKTKIETVIGMDCIVQTEEGKIYLRNVRKGPNPGTYNLVCNNPSTQVKDSVVYNIKLISAAPVIWHRKKDPS